MAGSDDSLIVLGEISGMHGVEGWVKVFSRAEPRESIVDFDTWLLGRRNEWTPFRVLDGRRQGKTVVARLEGVEDRDQAARLMKSTIAVRRSQLPRLGKDEFYWADLVGLEVETTEGRSLGKVDHLLETGANDVLVVRGDRERLIPFIQGQVIHDIDLDVGRMRVEWDPDF